MLNALKRSSRGLAIGRLPARHVSVMLDNRLASCPDNVVFNSSDGNVNRAAMQSGCSTHIAIFRSVSTALYSTRIIFISGYSTRNGRQDHENTFAPGTGRRPFTGID